MRFSPFFVILMAACTTDPSSEVDSWQSVDDVNEQTNTPIDADGIGLEASPARISFESSCRHAVDVVASGVRGAEALDALIDRMADAGGDEAAVEALRAARRQPAADRYVQLQNAASLNDLPGFSCPDLQVVLEERP
jgi:hypothetical protein